jgi:hypothetical protein
VPTLLESVIYMIKAENRLWNTIQLADCKGGMLNIIEKGNAFTLGRIMEYNHNLDEKYYEFTLTNGDSVMLEELSVYFVDCDRDNRVVINIYISDDYQVGCFTNDILSDDRNFQYYSIERVYENIPDID